MNAARRVAALALTALACLAAPATAQIALPFGSAGTANPVMSSKDWEAAVAAIGLDAQQRQVADALFNDAQDRMFAAKRTSDEARARVDPAATDERAAAARADARRALSQAMLAEIDGLFRTLGGVLRDEQRASADRVANSAKRRMIRAMLGGNTSGGPLQWDVERIVESTAIPAKSAEAAFAQLGPYRQDLLQRLQRLLDEDIAQARKSARDAAQPATSGPPEREAFAQLMARRSESRALARKAAAELADVHRAALASLAGTLPGDDLWAVRVRALERLWPGTAMDPESPEGAIDHVLKHSGAPEARAPVEQVRDAWRTRWWQASLRMTEAADGAQGGPVRTPRRDTAATRSQDDRESAEGDRRTADRDAWRALADADPDRKDYYLARAGGQRQPEEVRDRLDVRVAGLPAGAAPDGELPAGAVSIEASPVVASIAVVIPSPGDAEGEGAQDTLVLDAEALDAEGGMGVVFEAGDAEPIVLGDTLGDGMGSGGGLPGLEIEFDAEAAGLEALRSGGGLPGRMTAAHARDAARALGADPDSPAVRALLDDYDAATDAVRASVPGIGAVKAGRTERFPAADDKEIAATIARVLPALAAADDALIAGIGAIGGADGTAIDAVTAERTAQRLWCTSHRGSMMGSMEPPIANSVLLAGCVAAPGIPESERVAARAAWVEWAPSMRKAAERAFDADKAAAPDLRRLEAKMRDRVANAGGDPAAPLALEIDMEDMKLQRELTTRVFEARSALTKASLDGRRAVLDRLGPEGKAAFDSAWLRAAAPRVYVDRKDAMAVLDAAVSLPGMPEGQRKQLDALRGEHAARHGALCDRLANLFVEYRSGDSVPGLAALAGSGSANRQMTADLRFERAELNARTLRRLRAALTPEQAAAIPSLSPATTRPGPAPASP